MQHYTWPFDRLTVIIHAKEKAALFSVNNGSEKCLQLLIYHNFHDEREMCSINEIHEMLDECKDLITICLSSFKKNCYQPLYYNFVSVFSWASLFWPSGILSRAI